MPSRRRHPRAGALLLELLALYVGLNLLMLNLTPILHHVRLRVEVVMTDGSLPVSGASIGWARIPPHTAASECGTTDDKGTFEFTEVIPENPVWLWPKIGTFKFRNRVLEVGAPGFRTERIPLSDALPNLPYSRPNGEVRIRLRPQ